MTVRKAGCTAAVLEALITAPQFEDRSKSPRSDAFFGRVLVVEDEAVIAFDLEETLLDSGFEVLGPVGTVEDAFALIDAERCDVAVVDLSLNGRFSTTVAEKLIVCGIPTLLVSGMERSEVPPSLRAISFLSKPFRPHELVEHCRALAALGPAAAIGSD